MQGEEITTLRGHQESVFTAVFSQDGKEVVTGSSDETAKIWQLNNLNQTRSIIPVLALIPRAILSLLLIKMVRLLYSIPREK
jgi:WD40 repeat protein